MPASYYTRTLRKHLKFFANWPPGEAISLGTIGTLEDSQFIPLSHLRHRGIEFEIDTDDLYDDFEYHSSQGISIGVDGGADAQLGAGQLPHAKARFTINFSSNEAILFQIKQTANHRISDQIGLKEAIMKEFLAGNWEREWAVVTGVVECQHGTIIVSQGSGSSLEISAEGDGQAGKLDLAGVNARLSVNAQNFRGIQLVGKQGLTPLFRLSKVQKGFFSGNNFKPLRSLLPDQQGAPSESFEEIPVEEERPN